MVKQSAGLLAFRKGVETEFVFLVHPGGPYWAKRDLGSWSIPKGEFKSDEEGLTAARREFFEETGQKIDGDFIPLKSCRQAGGKTVYAWAVEAEVDENIVSNLFEMEWPPKSGRMVSIPEVDRGEWFSIDVAMTKILAGQRPLLSELQAIIGASKSVRSAKD